MIFPVSMDKSENFAQKQHNFEQTHARVSVTFRNSALQRSQLCQSVRVVSPDWTDKGGVTGIHCGLSHSTYKKVSANGPVSDFRKLAIRIFTFLLIKSIMNIFSWLHFYFFI